MRLELTMMLAYRHCFAILLRNPSEWCLFGFMDASPQWAGRELFAANLELVQYSGGRRTVTRFLLPLVNLGSAYRIVVGKTWAFLWMPLLMGGPDFWAMRTVLERLRSLTTDRGGEFRVRDVKDSLIGFFRAVGAHVPRRALVQQYLFPRCLAPAGRHHIFD